MGWERAEEGFGIQAHHPSNLKNARHSAKFSLRAFPSSPHKDLLFPARKKIYAESDLVSF